MSVQVRSRRESAAFLASFVGAQGELLVDTTNNRLQVHDGATPGGFSAARLSEVVTNTRTAVADAGYGVKATDRLVAFTALTAARAVTLPAASAFPTGTTLTIVDEAGTCSATNSITLTVTGSDTINGSGSASIAVAFGYLALESDGTSRWTIVDQMPSSSGGTSTGAGRTAVSDANYAAIVADRLIAFTTLAAARTVTLPAASVFPVATTLRIVDETGAASPANAITIVRTGSDTIDGIASATIASPYGVVALESNGVGKWTIVAQVAPVPARGAVRQTVQAGPLSGRLPSFLPATASSLTLTAQNISSSMPLIVAAAQGYGASGQVDIVLQLTSNPAWTLPASTTSYLFVNAATGAAVASSLAPIYQFGGAPSSTAGQFTFDYQAMAGYVGNSTAAMPTPLVCVGEAATSASAVTSAVAYAYNGAWDSGWSATLPAVNSGSGTLTHNVGLDQLVGQLTIACTAADSGSGFAVGDTSIGVLGGNLASSSTYYTPVNLATGRLTAIFVAAQAYALPKKTTGVVTAVTAASNFKWRVIVRRPW